MTAVQTRPGRVLLIRWTGLVAALWTVSWSLGWDDLGNSFSLTAPLLGIGLVLGVYAGDLVGPGRDRGPSRRALLETRRLVDYLPDTVRRVAWLLAGFGVATLLSSYPVGATVTSVCGSDADRWVPQRYAAIGVAGVAVGLALAAGVLRWLVTRPRPAGRDVAADDAHRREVAAAVVAACGVLVAGALAWSLVLLGVVLHDACPAGYGKLGLVFFAAALLAGATALAALWAVLVPWRPGRRLVSR
jgi:hypothetical protein